MHEPTSARADLQRVALLLGVGADLARSAGRGRGCAGPTRCGSSVDEVDLDDAVEEALGVGLDLGVGAQVLGVLRRRGRRCASRPVAFRYSAPCASSYGNSEQVAPISAPMLQIVALPVAEIDSAPGPKYSTIAPVPPFTVRMPATLRMTSLAAVQPAELAR